MSKKQYPIPAPQEQSLPYEAADMAQGVGIQLARFVFPLLLALDQVLDKRLVRTFLLGIQTIITFRDRVHGLLLSEMGAYLLSPEHERAGTKRLANLLHSLKWSSQIIDDFLWSWATTVLEQREAAGQESYAVWDESVWEKPESQKLARPGADPLQQGSPAHPPQTGLSSSPTPSDLCPQFAVGGSDPGCKQGATSVGSHAVVDQSRTPCRPSWTGRSGAVPGLFPPVGTTGPARL